MQKNEWVNSPRCVCPGKSREAHRAAAMREEAHREKTNVQVSAHLISEVQRHAEAAQKARALWDSAAPATGHAYLERKQCGAHGVRSRPRRLAAGADAHRRRARQLAEDRAGWHEAVPSRRPHQGRHPDAHRLRARRHRDLHRRGLCDRRDRSHSDRVAGRRRVLRRQSRRSRAHRPAARIPTCRSSSQPTTTTQARRIEPPASSGAAAAMSATRGYRSSPASSATGTTFWRARGWPAVVERLRLGRSEGDAISEAVLHAPGHEREVVGDARRLLRRHGPNDTTSAATRRCGSQRASTAGSRRPRWTARRCGLPTGSIGTRRSIK